ncbi:hypothetical protein HHI36_016455 [Cryptolaemus montrouzieri]|uniref:Uncharacterized protein n=1 Tax=Cryptolaemus montrouzieri TaxID=559131 RepID=A0ABD2NKK2_9CUCU
MYFTFTADSSSSSRDDWSFQVYKEMKKRYKCEIDAEIKRENLELIESLTNRNSTIWRVINENIEGSNIGREITPLDTTMMNQYFSTIGLALDDGVDRSEDAVGGIRIMSATSMFLRATTPKEIMNVVGCRN